MVWSTAMTEWHDTADDVATMVTMATRDGIADCDCGAHNAAASIADQQHSHRHHYRSRNCVAAPLPSMATVLLCRQSLHVAFLNFWNVRSLLLRLLLFIHHQLAD